MGAAQYWDDPDADLEKTVDLLIPPEVRERVEPASRDLAILREVIDAIRLVGVLLAVGGFAVAAAFLLKARPMVFVAAPVMGLVATPGVLYLIAAGGLTHRRYWAWVMSLIVTLLLMLTLFGVGVYFAFFASHLKAGEFVCPTALYFSMPCLILAYMLRALPVVREAELLVGKGFNILPAAPHADGPGSQPVLLKPESGGVRSRPEPAPHAPGPQTSSDRP